MTDTSPPWFPLRVQRDIDYKFGAISKEVTAPSLPPHGPATVLSFPLLHVPGLKTRGKLAVLKGLYRLRKNSPQLQKLQGLYQGTTFSHAENAFTKRRASAPVGFLPLPRAFSAASFNPGLEFLHFHAGYAGRLLAGRGAPKGR